LPLRLLQENFESFCLNISWESLLKTYQEAIFAVQRLGITLLWIDSLCIYTFRHQDSKEDWAYQSTTMATVYANCYINIPADASVDGNGGLFRNRAVSASSIQSIIIPSTRSDEKHHAYCCYVEQWSYFVEKSPLKNRVWVTQERFLTPRVLHFCEDQVHWECCEIITSEGAPDSLSIWPSTIMTPLKMRFRYDPFSYSTNQVSDDLYVLWNQITESYSSAELSFSSDKCIAIAGIARIFCHILGLKADDYICGLWRPHLIRCMMWDTQSVRRDGYQIPSWSWLSIGGGIRAPRYPLLAWKDIAEVIEVSRSPLRDAFGPVLSCYVKFRGLICQAVISQSSSPWENRSRGRFFIHIGEDLLREEFATRRRIFPVDDG
jgi:hypothetical protein